jgi:hypothetical protein
MINYFQGAMTFGVEGSEGARVHELKDVEAILDIFQSHGHNEVSPSIDELWPTYKRLLSPDRYRPTVRVRH